MPKTAFFSDASAITTLDLELAKEPLNQDNINKLLDKIKEDYQPLNGKKYIVGGHLKTEIERFVTQLLPTQKQVLLTTIQRQYNCDHPIFFSLMAVTDAITVTVPVGWIDIISLESPLIEASSKMLDLYKALDVPEAVFNRREFIDFLEEIAKDWDFTMIAGYDIDDPDNDIICARDKFIKRLKARLEIYQDYLTSQMHTLKYPKDLDNIFSQYLAFPQLLDQLLEEVDTDSEESSFGPYSR